MLALAKPKLLIALAATAVVVLSTGCSKSGSDRATGTPSMKPISVMTEAAKEVEMPAWKAVVGTIASEFSADISTRAPGRVTAVFVHEGERVRRGQPLLALDSRDLDASVQQARSEVAAATVAAAGANESARMAEATTAAQVTAAEAQVGQAQAALAAANARRDQVNAGPRPQERAQASQAVASANASLTLARKNYDRMAYLYKADAISAQQLDSYRSALDAAQANFQAATQAQSMVDEGSRAEDKAAAEAAVRQAQAALDQARAGVVQARASVLQVAVRRADVMQAKAQIGRARAGLGVAEANRSYTTITAPFDGVVVHRLVDPGAMAGPGVPLLQVQGGELRVEASVPESLLKEVHTGGTLPLDVDALGRTTLFATVVSISPKADTASHTFLVKARLPKGTAAQAGMFGRVSIPKGTERLLTVPSEAVVSRDGLSYVGVIESGVAKMRMVTTGEPLGQWATILTGLKAGDRVYTANKLLPDNTPVVEVK